jgi:hypothetical protein
MGEKAQLPSREIALLAFEAGWLARGKRDAEHQRATTFQELDRLLTEEWRKYEGEINGRTD